MTKYAGSGPFWSLNEREFLFDLIMSDSQLFRFFGFILQPAIQGLPADLDYLFLLNLNREYLGFDAAQPGDFDLIIVPVVGRMTQLNRACAVEVKLIKQRGIRRGKDANKSGLSQARGLLRDGFPYVGVLHITLMLDPLPKSEWVDVSVFRVTDSDTMQVEPLEPTKIDPSFIRGPARQFGRLKASSSALDPVGLNAVVPHLSSDGFNIVGCTVNNQRLAKKNSHVSTELMRSLHGFIVKKFQTEAKYNAEFRLIHMHTNNRSELEGLRPVNANSLAGADGGGRTRTGMPEGF